MEARIIDGVPHVNGHYYTIVEGELVLKEYWIPATEINGDEEE